LNAQEKLYNRINATTDIQAKSYFIFCTAQAVPYAVPDAGERGVGIMNTLEVIPFWNLFHAGAGYSTQMSLTSSENKFYSKPLFAGLEKNVKKLF